MAEDVHILGADIPRSRLPLYLGGAALIGFIFLRSRTPNTAGPSAAADLSASNQAAMLNLEYQMLQDQSQFQLAQLASMTSLQQQQLNEAYNISAGMNPGLLQNCIPYTEWYQLDSATRNSVMAQVNNGQLTMTPSLNGWCFTPTQMGIAGHPPIVTNRSSTGLFGSSGSTTGYPSTVGGAPTAQQPYIIQLLQALGL